MKDWTPFIPPWDSQYSATTHVDAQDCTEESFCHIVYMLTGVRYSPRALGYLTDVTPTGSSVSDCLAAVARYGLIPYDLWPTPDSFTWESYYAPIPPEVLAQAQFWNVGLIPADLDVSPLWTELMFNQHLSEPGPAHMVAQINETQYFDSEQGAPIKPLTFSDAGIIYQTSIKLTRRNMGQFKTQNYKGELRIVLQADNEQTWLDLCKVYGVDPTKIDEIIN